MKKAFFVILAVFTIFIEANGTIGSPEVSINSKGNYLIEIQMSNFASLEEEDIVVILNLANHWLMKSLSLLSLRI